MGLHPVSDCRHLSSLSQPLKLALWLSHLLAALWSTALASVDGVFILSSHLYFNQHYFSEDFRSKLLLYHRQLCHRGPNTCDLKSEDPGSHTKPCSICRVTLGKLLHPLHLICPLYETGAVVPISSVLEHHREMASLSAQDCALILFHSITTRD